MYTVQYYSQVESFNDVYYFKLIDLCFQIGSMCFFWIEVFFSNSRHDIDQSTRAFNTNNSI